MVVTTLTIETRLGALAEALDSASDWPDDKREAFLAEWNELVKNGAEIAEVRLVGSRVVGFPSDDIAMHCAKWGLKSWPV